MFFPTVPSRPEALALSQTGNLPGNGAPVEHVAKRHPLQDTAPPFTSFRLSMTQTATPSVATQDSAYEALQEAIEAIMGLLDSNANEPSHGDLCPCCGDFLEAGHACQ